MMKDKKAKLHTLYQKHIKAGKKITAKMLLGLPVSKGKKGVSPAPYTIPRNAVEKKLVDAWAVVLGMGRDTHRIAIDTKFTSLGGDSLKATILAANLHKIFDVKFSLGDVFKHSTIRQMTQYIHKATKEWYISIEPTEEKSYYPLSSAQKRLYILQELEKGSTGYNVPVAAWLEGQLDKQKLENAFKELIKRHESLRTSFHMLNNEPVQKILPKEKVKVKVEEETYSPKDIIRDFIHPFDLSRAPLLRVGLIETGNLMHILMLDIHHIIADGTSFGILFNQLMVLYAEEGKSLPPLRLQYKDYSQWQNSKAYQKSIQKQEKYWLTVFDDEIPMLNLACDYPRPVLQSFEGRRIGFEIGAGQADTIKKLAQNNEATLYMVLLALYTLLLAKLSGQEDIIVGTAAAGRNNAELQGIVGMFVNTLTMRNRPVGEKSFRQFLQEVKKKSMEAFENQDYPFEELVDRLEVTKDASRNPLFDTMFTLFTLDLQRFQNSRDGIPEVEIPGLSLKPYNYDPGISMFDLSLMAAEIETESGSELRFTLEYCTKLFKQETIEWFIAYFNQLAVSVLEDPGRKMMDIEIISPEEKRRVLIDFNDTAEDFPKGKTIHGLFEDQAARTPDGVAVVGSWQLAVGKGAPPPASEERKTGEAGRKAVQLTYGELNKKSGQLAHLLREQGVWPGHIVALMVERSVEMMAAILGILKAGAAYLPIDPDCPRERLDYMLKDSKAQILLAAPAAQVKVKAEVEEESVELIDISKELLPSTSTLTSTLGKVSSPNLAYIIYTSGSTGKPKGVMVPHSSVVCRLYGIQRKFSLNETDVVVHQTPYTFDVSVCELFRWIPVGGKGLFLPPGGEKDLAVIVKAIAHHWATTIDFIPSMLKLFLEYLENRDSFHLVSSLRWVLVGVEAVAVELVKKFNDTLLMKFGTRLINAYGPTEATVEVTHFDCSEIGDLEIVPIGKPIANVLVYILDRYLRPQPIGIAGELSIGGQTLAAGYMNIPELTAEKFDQDLWDFQDFQDEKKNKKKGTGKKENKNVLGGDSPLKTSSVSLALQMLPHAVGPGRRRQKIYKTGDLARWLSDGNIEFIGRVDFQVKIRGHRVELGEIENQLLNHEAIKEVVVIVNEREGDKYLCAYFVGDFEKTPTKTELKEYVLDKLPGYMIPLYFIPQDKIPRTCHGKVDRKALPEPELAVGGKSIAPRDEIEEKLAAIWQEILFGKGTLPPSIGIDDDFFRLGGQSLKAAIMVSKILQEFQVKLPLAEIFRTSTIRGLSRFLKEAEKKEFISVAPAEARDYYPLSSAQKRLFILQQMDAASTAYNIPQFVTLIGAVDVPRIKNVFKQLIQRHESLRTSFQMINGEPVQRINEKVEVEEETHSPKEVIRDFLRPFDLSLPSLLRVGFIETGDRECLLMMDMHHIISDGISLSLLFRELTSLYAGILLPDLWLQYKDYALWENSREFQADVQLQETWWLKQFEYKTEIPLLNLPLDYSRPVVQGFDGATYGFEISPAETRQLKALAQMENITFFMLLLAVLNVFLSRLSSQEDIIIGTPTAGRHHQGLQPVIGMFVNTLALRNAPWGEKIFAAFLQEVKERSLQAFENQDYPFENLVEQVTVSRDASRNPLFDVMFVLQNTDDMVSETEIPGLQMQPAAFENRTAKFDFTLEAVETSDQIFCSLEYNTGLFKKETVERFVRYLKNILSSVPENPAQRIADIELLPEEEKQQLLVEFNDTNVGYPKEKTLHQLFEKQAEKTPDGVAVVGSWQLAVGKKERVEEGVQLTYRKLNEKSDKLAHLLRGKGVTPDIIVALRVDRSVEMIIGMLGILKAGGAYLPISPNYPQERIDYMLSDSNAKILLSEVSVLSKVSEEFPTHPTHLTHPTQLCYLLYTSGSTGQPKGVAVEHRSAVNTVHWFAQRYGLQPGMRVVMLTEYTFDASVNQVFATLLYGATLYIVPLEMMADIPNLRQFIAENRTNLVNFIPYLLDQLLSNDEKIKSLQWVISGGESLDERVKNNICAKGYQLHNQYGPTETTIDALAAFCTENDPVYLGTPIANTRCYILDKYDNLVPIGVTGELYIAGTGAARGYLNHPELTAEKFILAHSSWLIADRKMKEGDALPDSGSRDFPMSYELSAMSYFYKTGDLARWLPDGNIEFRGRMDYQVKINGYRIELGEVEAALKKINGVKEVVVTAAEEAGERFLCAYVVPTPEQVEASEKALKQWESGLRMQLSDQLPEYMIPWRFVLMEMLPLTPTGKVDRKALPKPQREGAAETEDSIPTSEVEKKLARICCAVLERETIGIQDDFFTSGGNSLKLIKLAAEIHRHFHSQVPLSHLFKKPTVKSIAHAIFNYKSIIEEEVVVFNESKAKKIFCFPPAIGFGIAYADFSTQLQDFSLYAFNYIDLDNEALIRRYKDFIMKNQPEGHAALLGYSAGGKVALYTAAALEKAGYSISNIILVDCYQTQQDLGVRELEALDRQFDQEIEKSITRMGIEYMKKEIFQRIENYSAFHKRLIKPEPVNARIHLITASDRKGLKEITPRMHWDNLTLREYIIYPGYGTHREMFDAGYIEKNARIVKDILI
ncbi:MAG: amino acid adenylation domain-containing protein [Candidatus Aminicenantes bacterium]|nr:amino acid adenylation domain-containing protein [Candidatus Aminicenantes bacterium]NIM79886.1 amino acid adenylation domain-containing protein [Candidatus Aminicenantes bacterium]NIN19223.1 amino acid adenylation domain-containing protein [Candidatus Aminicenantes bacterium]NIN43128.1 amino acid adenylation domain-containing protein [Candidatus Aminicenantes bacterium]NIN85865.1 amino acid adenylation domain-containing protein [Candidatus Aminicenantes bacterium]